MSAGFRRRQCTRRPGTGCGLSKNHTADGSAFLNRSVCVVAHTDRAGIVLTSYLRSRFVKQRCAVSSRRTSSISPTTRRDSDCAHAGIVSDAARKATSCHRRVRRCVCRAPAWWPVAAQLRVAVAWRALSRHRGACHRPDRDRARRACRAGWGRASSRCPPRRRAWPRARRCCCRGKPRRHLALALGQQLVGLGLEARAKPASQHRLVVS